MYTDQEFTQLVHRYADTIFRVAFSWLKNADDANDVTQDVLITLYRTNPPFDSEAHLKNWLIRVTINRCKMLFRAPWRKHEDIADYAETLGFEEPGPSELFQAVMALDRAYRVPILLFYYEGYSTKEIAALLRLPENTVSTRLARARKRLKHVLEEEPYHD